jgi:phosphatidylglycerophosphate synthase
MSKLEEYMSVSRRGNLPTRYLARPLASLLLSIIPQFVEKRTTPNRISAIAFGLSCAGNVYLLSRFKSDSENNTITILVWLVIQYFAYVLDCADGQFARRNQMTSAGGKILDMLLDLARDIVRLLTLIIVFINEPLNLIAFTYLLLRIFWISSWAAIELLNVNHTNSVSPSENGKRVFKTKKILIAFSTFMQDGVIDILCCLIIIIFFTLNLGGTVLFAVFYAMCISAILINIVMVFRRVLKND